MFCKKCGCKINIGMKYCPKCGHKVNEEHFNDIKNIETKKEEVEESKSIDKHSNKNKTILDKEDIYLRAMELSELSEYKDKKVTKIKILREEFGIGLVEAKTIIEEVENSSFNFENENENSTFTVDIDQKLNQNNNNDDYDELFKNSVSKEEEYTNYEYGVDVLIFIISTVYYMKNGEDFIVSIVSAVVLASIASIIVSRIFKSIKKEDGCYRAKEKYDKYNILKQSMEASIAIHMVNLEFDKSNQEKHGLLYYLVCVIAVILIFALC